MTFTCSRRTFLLGTATTFAGAVLAACGGDAAKAATIPTAEVPVGGAVIVEDFIVAQPTAGNFVAYSSKCPHAGYPIGTINDDGTVTCEAHGSKFDLTTGAVVQAPATTGLTAQVTANDGTTLTINP
ncbi:MAG: Rieske 2Fe-2S domain-containing protein [Corynebacterium sp.]|nr:Rieske 2Fe-2S domain-containing protein [Corynebacterium sp.]